MNQPNIKELKGEELAEILGGAYQQLQIAQGNILAINNELERRKQPKEAEVVKE